MRKWLVGLIAAIAVISVGGVGFAAFTSTVSLKLNGAAGSLDLQWTGPSLPPVTVVHAIPSDTASCGATLSPSSLVLSLKNAAPNDTCTIPAGDLVQIQNTGTLNGVVTFGSQFTLTGFCSWATTSNLFSISSIGPGVSLPAGGAIIIFGIYTPVTPGNTCQGSTLIWYLNWTATAGT